MEAHLSPLHLCALGIKCRQPIGSSSSLPLKPTCTFTPVDLRWWIYQEVGMKCLPADENDLLVHEVEGLQQEGKTWRGARAPGRNSLCLVLKTIKTIWVGNKQKVRHPPTPPPQPELLM